MPSWSVFHQTLAGASASLLGLLFVTVSVNAAASVGHEPARRLALQAFQNYTTALVAALVALVPDVKPHALGVVFIGLAGFSPVLAFTRALRSLRSGVSRKGWRTTRRYAASFAGFGLLAFSGWKLLRGDAEYQPYLAGALILLLSSATFVAWELLLQIAAAER
jgi:hypothetical protein